MHIRAMAIEGAMQKKKQHKKPQKQQQQKTQTPPKNNKKPATKINTFDTVIEKTTKNELM